MLNIAHRGAVAYAPENTIAAFCGALDAHVDMIELDVRICKTGEPVVIHDATVNRTTNGKGRVKDLTLEQIRALRINHTNGKEQIPTLEEVLNLLAGKVIINLDIKARKSVPVVITLLQRYIQKQKLSYNDILIASSNLLTLRDVNRHDPLLLISVIIRYLPSLVIRASSRFKPFSIQPINKITTKTLVHNLHERDIKVFPWALKTTDDDKQFFSKMKKLGIDGIISFFPERLREHEKQKRK